VTALAGVRRLEYSERHLASGAGYSIGNLEPRSSRGSFLCRRTRYIPAMRSLKKKANAAKLRPWRASLMRARNYHLGIVYALDEKAAEAAAIAEFKIGEDMRRRLIVRPDD
jgi:hypothetical protein